MFRHKVPHSRRREIELLCDDRKRQLELVQATHKVLANSGRTVGRPLSTYSVEKLHLLRRRKILRPLQPAKIS
jgi:hypothetical protein